MDQNTLNTLENQRKHRFHRLQSEGPMALYNQEVSIEELDLRLTNNNNRNRVMTPGTTKRYRSDVANGRWESDLANWIQFDWNGELINGQHTWYAHLKEGKTWRGKVEMGLDPRCILHIDINLERKAEVNHLLLRGIEENRKIEKSEFKNHKAKLTVARIWITCETGVSKPTPMELNQFYINHRESIDFATNGWTTTFGKTKKCGPRPGVLAALANCYERNQALAKQVKVLLDRGESVRGDAIRELRELMQGSSIGGSQLKHDYFTTVHYTHKFCKGVLIKNEQIKESKNEAEWVDKVINSWVSPIPGDVSVFVGQNPEPAAVVVV